MKRHRQHNKRVSYDSNIAKAFLVLLLLHGMNSKHCCQSLRLNPVNPLPIQPLSDEAGSIISSFYEAKSLVSTSRSNENENKTENLLNASRILRTVLNRWKNLEHKYLASTNPDNTTLFDDTTNNVANTGIFLAKIYSEINETELAIAEYENACPRIMGIQISRKSFDSVRDYKIY